jgi:hypothetical protein
LEETYKFLSPDLWGKTVMDRLPIEEHSKWLNKAVEDKY